MPPLSVVHTRQICLKKLQDKIDPERVNPALGEAIAKSMVKSGSGKKYMITAQQLVECRVPGVTREQASEHIAKTLESLAGDDRPRPYLTNRNSVLRDAIGAPTLKYIFLPRRSVQHIFGAGQNMYAAAYRDMIFDMNDALLATFVAIQGYNEKKEESHLERSAAHQEIQNFVRENGLIAPREKTDGTPVSSKKQASAKTAGMYVDYYTTAGAIHPTKKPRVAAASVGVAMTSQPIIHQTTDVCMKGAALFMSKVMRKLALAQQRGIEMTMGQAQRKVADEDRRRKTYVQQDFDGYDYGEDDQVRAMTDDAFAAVGVAFSSLPALPAPQ